MAWRKKLGYRIVTEKDPGKESNYIHILEREYSIFGFKYWWAIEVSKDIDELLALYRKLNKKD